ncbi:ornithine carbamoyltransferase [Patescibacteria group bacterium]|nr:ornithine carbamoyltransferase [Patescibacteria group bacterium]
MKHFLSIVDVSREELANIIEKAVEIKKHLKENGANNHKVLQDKTLAMIFEKPSLRTRLSFEAGMTQLGGHAIYLGPSDIGLGKRESVHDIAKTTSGMCDIIMARVFEHANLIALARDSRVPVINALSDLEHPCQALADFMTIKEKKGKLSGLTLAFVGDGNNNVTHSLALAAALLGVNFRVASPEKHRMKREIYSKAEEIAGSDSFIFETLEPQEAVRGADVVYTDTWVSMGSENEKEERLKDFYGFQVTAELMRLAKPEAVFMHDLPAYRGSEVVAEVIDGPQSIVFDQAENRLHVQKSLILFLLDKFI